MRPLRISLAQLNTTVGDFNGNAALIRRAVADARAAHADIVAVPELAVTGYPPEDLVLYPEFVADSKACMESLARDVRDVIAIIGFVDEHGGQLFNAAAVVADGRVQTVYHKIDLPNYGVFDERRYFVPGRRCPVLDVDGVRVGVSICEDIWKPVGPAEVESAAGAHVIININGSPYWFDKHHIRVKLVTELARRNRVFAAYVNQVGGQDELVFDGGSMVAGPDGTLLALARRFEENVLTLDIDPAAVYEARLVAAPRQPPPEKMAAIGEAFSLDVPTARGASARPPVPEPELVEMDRLEEAYRALVLGTRDYVRKTGFQKVLVALSGGIDSSLVATVAVDAIGPENVTGLSLPSRYSSEGSVSDAADLANRLGIKLWSVPIEPGHRAFEEMLGPVFQGTEPGTAEENMQSRIRGNVVMSISNKFGWLVLTTGNKSEMATGYATLYGDMAGGFAVIKDVPKMLVYALAEYRNRTGPGKPIPQAVIDKPPSAELRPGQLDTDSLPPYSVLDRVLEQYIVDRLPVEEIVARESRTDGAGADEATVRRIIGMVDRSEYKRRQSPPGVKITPVAFGRDRRLPIASRYTH